MTITFDVTGLGQAFTGENAIGLWLGDNDTLENYGSITGTVRVTDSSVKGVALSDDSLLQNFEDAVIDITASHIDRHGCGAQGSCLRHLS